MCYGCCSFASMNICLGGGHVYIGTFVIYDDMHHLQVQCVIQIQQEVLVNGLSEIIGQKTKA